MPRGDGRDAPHCEHGRSVVNNSVNFFSLLSGGLSSPVVDSEEARKRPELLGCAGSILSVVIILLSLFRVDDLVALLTTPPCAFRESSRER